jgi:signal transduction histidine kinase
MKRSSSWAPHASRPRRGRRLQARIFLWFLMAIVMAAVASGLTFHFTRSDAGENPARVVSTTVARRLGRVWEDRAACDAYVAQLREDMGLELTLIRDPREVPESIQRRPHRAMSFDASGYGYVPVTREGRLVGALRFETGSRPPRPGGIVVALAAALLVLAIAARVVSRQLARPIEDVARAAERFGEGNLSVRTDVANRKHWVADEVRNLAHSFDRMAERIESIVRDQRELLGAISHELRSPLGRARVALEIARERGQGDADNLDRVEKELGNVDLILGDLLAATRAGLTDLRREEVALRAWLRARLESEPTPPAIRLDGSEDARASIDAALLGRAVHNLLDNARAHGHPKDEPLVVRLERDGDRARIVVRDRGPGFPPGMLARAFEPFVRGDTARKPSGGSGLGLALVRRIAEAHGGKATARNVDGGAEVSVEIPLGDRSD